MSADRLGGLQLPRSNELPQTKGYGHKVWETRRSNKFYRAVGALVRQDRTLDELRLAAYELSDQLADSHLGEALPRGYRFTLNCHGDRSLSLGETLFGPGLRDSVPSEEAIAQLGRDLKTGWLQELESGQEAAK